MTAIVAFFLHSSNLRSMSRENPCLGFPTTRTMTKVVCPACRRTGAALVERELKGATVEIQSDRRRCCSGDGRNYMTIRPARNTQERNPIVSLRSALIIRILGSACVCVPFLNRKVQTHYTAGGSRGRLERKCVCLCVSRGSSFDGSSRDAGASSVGRGKSERPVPSVGQSTARGTRTTSGTRSASR
jgi:hypothetical protein